MLLCLTIVTGKIRFIILIQASIIAIHLLDGLKPIAQFWVGPETLAGFLENNGAQMPEGWKCEASSIVLGVC